MTKGCLHMARSQQQPAGPYFLTNAMAPDLWMFQAWEWMNPSGTQNNKEVSSIFMRIVIPSIMGASVQLSWPFKDVTAYS